MPNCAKSPMPGALGLLTTRRQLFPRQVEGSREHQETNHDPNDQADSWIEVERRLIDGFQSDPP